MLLTTTCKHNSIPDSSSWHLHAESKTYWCTKTVVMGCIICLQKSTLHCCRVCFEEFHDYIDAYLTQRWVVRELTSCKMCAILYKSKDELANGNLTRNKLSTCVLAILTLILVSSMIFLYFLLLFFKYRQCLGQVLNTDRAWGKSRIILILFCIIICNTCSPTHLPNCLLGLVLYKTH